MQNVGITKNKALVKMFIGVRKIGPFYLVPGLKGIKIPYFVWNKLPKVWG